MFPRGACLSSSRYVSFVEPRQSQMYFHILQTATAGVSKHEKEEVLTLPLYLWLFKEVKPGILFQSGISTMYGLTNSKHISSLLYYCF